METLAERIRTARKQVGLSQADIAKALRISASAVNQWEHGLTKNMRLAHFFALASLLEKDPRWLATGKAQPRARTTTSSAHGYPAPTTEERALLHYVRQMPDTMRKQLLRFLAGLSNNYNNSHDKPGHGA